MKPIHEIPHTDWNSPFESDVQQEALEALEGGAVLFFPKLGFPLTEAEVALRSPRIIDKSKNVSYNPANDKLGGTICTGEEADLLKRMIARYAAQTKRLINALLPGYTKGLIQARTSFRPVEVAGRQSSWRKDDTRLHVDSFPTSPTQGKRIMRIFNNVNPERPRVWKVGEPFEDLAKRFFSKLTGPVPGSAAIMHLLHLTRARRSDYDHFMLKLHDRMKEDTNYQETVPQIRQDFPPGSTWLTFSDQVSHAALTGQHQFEQSYLLPVDCMKNPDASPLRVLERLANRKLA